MCYYITTTLPGETDIRALLPIIKEYRLDFSPVENPYVKSQLKKSVQYFRATNKYCDCDTPLGSLNKKIEPKNKNDKNLKRRLNKFMKQGWSDTKIKKWLAQQEKNNGKSVQKEIQIKDSMTEKIEDWVYFIKSILESMNTESIGILIHFYKGNTDTEKINLKKRIIVRLKELNEDILLNMDEDILYEFTR